MIQVTLSNDQQEMKKLDASRFWSCDWVTHIRIFQEIVPIHNALWKNIMLNRINISKLIRSS